MHICGLQTALTSFVIAPGARNPLVERRIVYKSPNLKLHNVSGVISVSKEATNVTIQYIIESVCVTTWN